MQLYNDMQPYIVAIDPKDCVVQLYNDHETGNEQYDITIDRGEFYHLGKKVNADPQTFRTLGVTVFNRDTCNRKNFKYLGEVPRYNGVKNCDIYQSECNNIYLRLEW